MCFKVYTFLDVGLACLTQVVNVACDPVEDRQNSWHFEWGVDWWSRKHFNQNLWK